MGTLTREGGRGRDQLNPLRYISHIMMTVIPELWYLEIRVQVAHRYFYLGPTLTEIAQTPRNQEQDVAYSSVGDLMLMKKLLMGIVITECGVKFQCCRC